MRALRKLDPVHVREIVASIDAAASAHPYSSTKMVSSLTVLARGWGRPDWLGSRACPTVSQSLTCRTKSSGVLHLALNQLAEKGDWDLDELKIEFEELRLLEAPIELSSFALDEIDQIVICGEGRLDRG